MQSSPSFIEILKSIPWFLELKPEQLEHLAEIASVCELAAGEPLCLEGDREDNLYIILEGQVEVATKVPMHGNVHLLSADPLDIIGWSALTPVVRQRIASACATQPTRLIWFEGEALRRLCDQDHDLGYIIMRRVSNIVASWLLEMRLQLLDVVINNHENGAKNQIAY